MKHNARFAVNGEVRELVVESSRPPLALAARARQENIAAGNVDVAAERPHDGDRAPDLKAVDLLIDRRESPPKHQPLIAPAAPAGRKISLFPIWRLLFEDPLPR